MQERISEVEKTRIEYNKARAKVGDAHKAAVKLHAKADATKIDEDQGVVQANLVLEGESSQPARAFTPLDSGRACI